MITEHEIVSPRIAAPRKVRVHRHTPDATGDCLLFLDGELYADRVKAPDVVRALPLASAVYVSGVSPADRQVDYTCNQAFASFVALELPRWIEREVGPYGRLFLCGLSLSGLQAIYTAREHPGVFAGVLSQSPSAWWNDEWLAASLAPTPVDAIRCWMSVGTQEVQAGVSHPPTNLHQATSQLDSVRRLARRMTEVGHEVHCHEYDGGHDPVCWNAELPDALVWLLDR